MNCFFFSLFAAYLDVTIAPSEYGDDWKAADDDDLQDKNCSPHDPVESYDTRAIIQADIASFRTR